MLSSLVLACLVRLAAAAGPSAVQPFAGYRELFSYIAEREELPTDPDAILKLAAESSLAEVRARADESYIVVRVDFRADTHVSKVRGAQGNGPFYVLRREGGRFRLLGTMFGNSYVWGSRNGNLFFTVSSHMSAEHSDTATYRVAGNVLVKE